MWSFDSENTVDCSHRSWIEILLWKEVEFTFPPNMNIYLNVRFFFFFKYGQINFVIPFVIFFKYNWLGIFDCVF